ncbi:MAG: hypothetical protein LBB36_06830 [Fibromonadaceae bacterium]|jgi:hypothetical protein|nr:hypothetical protein [Fibromonadaceae bacterium]
MNFAFICDTYFQKKVSGSLVNGEVPNHKIVTLTASEFLETGKLPEGVSGVLVEHGTWQKNFSLFRYFGLLPLLEKQSLAFVAATDAEFKGRSLMKGKEFIIPNGINPEDASAQLGRLLELPPPAFAHPKSRAIA